MLVQKFDPSPRIPHRPATDRPSNLGLSSSPSRPAAAIWRWRYGLALALVALLPHVAVAPDRVLAGGTPATGATTDQLMTLGCGGATAGVGDFISSFRQTVPTLNLDEPYFFYIEVPPGATDLQVELFDADVLQGGAGEITAERDQDRTTTINSKTRYRLYDPDGNLVPIRIGYGDDTNPSSADNAWLLMFDNTTALITGGDTFADNFGSNAYTNNDGNQNFATNWIESNDLGGAGATTGDIQVTGGELQIDNQSDSSPFTNQPSIEREMDLSSYVAAVVTFDWRTLSGVDRISGANIGDSIAIEASSDGGTTYEVIDEFGGLVGVQSGSAAYDITGFISNQTRVRIRITNRYAAANETILFDNFQVRATTTANGSNPDAGHWQLEVDASGDVNGHVAGFSTGTRQDDVNAVGFRAHDGTSGAGGTEYNLYADSYIIVGINDNDGSRTYAHYPYVTQGCSADVHDFDFDANQPNPPAPNTNTQPFGSLTLTTRSGILHHTNATMSDNDLWNSQTMASWSLDDEADDYGIWTMDSTIDDWTNNNYGPIYMTNDEGSAAPPSASPEAESFRIYFPNDAGSAPAKPYLSQYLNYVDGQSTGDNPPLVGQTSRYAVTILVANPTGSIGDISFPGALVVTGHIPSDTQTTYEGVAFTTAGTVVSQPALGATTGDITWNPGTISPGSSESLVYYVDVSPTAAGSYLMTGANLSGDGTRATWLDETGDQNFTFGELCELTVVAAPQTPVLVSSFEAFVVDGRVMVQWQTAAEAESVAFDLYRHDANGRTRVNGQPLPALLGRPQGGVYRLIDRGASPADSLHYSLEEIESDGGRRAHGPFLPSAVARNDLSLPQRDFERWHHPRMSAGGDAQSGLERTSSILDSPHQSATVPDALTSGKLRRFGARTTIEEGTGLRLETSEAGLYRVGAAELAATLGVELSQIQRLLVRQALRITVGGEGDSREEVAWRALPHGEGLELFAAGFESPFTKGNTYFVAIEPGTAMTPVRGPLPAGDWDGESSRVTVRAEDGAYGVVLMDLDPDGDTWFWDFVSQHPSHLTKSFPIEAPAPLVGGGNATLTVFLQGALPGEHRLAIALNGDPLGEMEITDLDAGSASFAVDPSSIIDGENSVAVTSSAGSTVFVDAFELEYERLHLADNGRLQARADGHHTLTAWGFANADVRVFDIADPQSPRPVAARIVSETGGHRAIWQADGDGPYLVLDGNGVAAASVALDSPSNLAAPENAADYLVITTEALRTGAEALAAHRANQGHLTRVVDVQDIYDEWSHGRRDPRAVRAFLAHASATWATAPRWVVLAGAASYDHRDYLGYGQEPLPPIQASNGKSLFASDTSYAARDEHGAPTMIVGRLPVRSAAEIETYLAKIVAYEAGTAPGLDRIELIADATDTPLDFPAENTHLRSLVAEGWNVGDSDLDQHDLGTARNQLMTALDQGLAWLHYSGHGGVDRLSSQGLLVSDDVASLANTDRLPVVSSVTCHIGLHALPGFDALGEFLVAEPGKGAIAVFAPSWLVPHPEARLVGDRLFRQVFRSKAPEAEGSLLLGEALLLGFSEASAIGIDREVLDTYQLLGDPALRLTARPSATDGGGCEPNCSGPG